MGSSVPEYYLPRHFDFPPDGDIQIGKVFFVEKEPHKAKATVKPDDNMIVKTEKTFAEIEVGRGKSGGVTVSTSFLSSLLGIGADVGADSQTTLTQTFSFDSIDTQYVRTSDTNSGTADQTLYEAYLDRCVKQPRIMREVERQWFMKNVYVITGVKTVRGAKCTTVSSQAREGHIGVQIDPTLPTGGLAPTGVGQEVHGGREKSLKMSWNGSSDFVLAYKYSELRVNRAGVVKKEKEVLKGAFMELSKEDSEEDLVLTIVEQHEVKNATAVAVAEGEEEISFRIFGDS